MAATLGPLETLTKLYKKDEHVRREIAGLCKPATDKRRHVQRREGKCSASRTFKATALSITPDLSESSFLIHSPHCKGQCETLMCPKQGQVQCPGACLASGICRGYGPREGSTGPANRHESHLLLDTHYRPRQCPPGVDDDWC